MVSRCLSRSGKHAFTNGTGECITAKNLCIGVAVQGTLGPGAMSGMQNGDLDMDNINEKLKDMNLTPEQVVQKMVSEPELAQVHVQDL